MAKNIDFMGAIFPDVPSVKLPQQSGGLVAFDDTTDATVTADKILQGYTAYANGQKLVGTASGGGGASNVVTGSFKFEGTTSHAETINLDYNGNGYPIFVAIRVKGGLYGNADFLALIRRYAYCMYTFQKSYESTPPTWTGSGDENSATGLYYYKNSTTSATTYSQSGTYALKPYMDANASQNSSHLQIVRLKDSKTMSVWITGSGTQAYGFPSGIEYDYTVVYSS